MLHAPFGQRHAVGVDLHKTTMTVAILDTHGGAQRFEKLACKSRQRVREFFASLPADSAVAIEAVGFYRWLWDELEPIVPALHLADATQCRALAGRRIKTDRQDAANVAELLAAGRLPIAFAPPGPIALLRRWTRRRARLSREHARLLTSVNSLMDQFNRPGPRRMKSSGLTRYINAHGGLLPDDVIDLLWMDVDRLALIERQQQTVDRRLATLAAHPACVEPIRRLRTAPGIGDLLGPLVLAEIGDFARFADRESIVAYAGLQPRTFASASTVRTGRIAKTGSRTLRWGLVQAAWVAVRDDEALRGAFERIERRAGRKKAVVAVAKRLLMILWAMMRDGTDYRRAQAPEAAA